MGGCFSTQQNGDDDMIARLMSNQEYMQNLSGFDKAWYERITTPTHLPTPKSKSKLMPTPTQRPTPTTKQNATTFTDPNWSFDYPPHVLLAMKNKTCPMCYFGAGCKRKSSMHACEFSHDAQNNNGTVGSREACCKAYQEETVQTSLGGGCAGGIRYRQPPPPPPAAIVRERLDECTTNSGCTFFTSDGYVVCVVDHSGKVNFSCGDRNPSETVLGCAVRETREELGFDSLNGQHVNHKGTFVKTHVSKRTGRITQTAIYVFQHSQPSSWFIQNFRKNNECSAIVVMPILTFQYNVEHNPNMFRFPESMLQFAAQML